MHRTSGGERRSRAARWARGGVPRLVRAGPDGAVTALNAAVAIAAAVLFLAVAWDAGEPPGGEQLPWYALAAAFAFTEIVVVHVQLRREAHTLSLAEIAVVLGLFYAAPWELLAGQTAGVAVALALHRRQALRKLAFNVASGALATTVAIVAFHAVLSRGGDAFGRAGWVATLTALGLAEVVSVALVLAVIGLAQARPTRRQAAEALGLGLTVTLANTSLGLFAVLVVHTDAEALWLLAVPLAAIVLAYRAYTANRRRRGQVEALHDSFADLPEAPEPDSVGAALLEQAHRVFGTDVAELTLVGDRVTRTTLRAGLPPVMVADVALDPAERRLLEDGPDRLSRLLAGRGADAELRGALAGRGLGDAMLAAVRGGPGTATVLAVGAPVGDVDAYTGDDLMVFETFASHAVVALQNGHLTRSLLEVTELKDQLRHKAFHDALTGLANRALLVDRIEHALARRDRDLAVLFLDLDDFKTINDSLGHVAGDRVLAAAAERLRACLRPGDTVARFGGDEFAVLLEGVSEAAPAVLVAERITAALRAPIWVFGREVVVGASIGVVLADETTDSADDLLRDADVAMYGAKEAGKGGYRFFERSMQQAVVRRHELKEDLQRAVENGEFELHYQPFVDLAAGRVTAVEALVRWRHPRRGLVYPGDFIPIAEETGLMLPIGRIVLETACRQASAWHRRLPEHGSLAVSVNLSAVQLRHEGFVEDVERVLAHTSLPPDRLILEITESVAMTDTQSTIGKLEDLSRAGVRLALDDFGTGYSSLSYLQRFPFDILKIAKPFVDDIADGPAPRAFASTMVKLAEALELDVVAEGIEDDRQLDALRELGCHYGQGYRFSRPVAAAAMEALLRD